MPRPRKIVWRNKRHVTTGMILQRHAVRVALCILALACARQALSAEWRPLALDEVEMLLLNSVSSRRIAVLVREHCVDFSLPDGEADRLRSLGLEDTAIKAIRESYRGEKPEGGGLRVLSEPEGADVYLRDKHMGATPLRLIRLPPGRIEIRVGGLTGYREETREEEVLEGEVKSIRISLKRAEIPRENIGLEGERKVGEGALVETTKPEGGAARKPSRVPLPMGTLHIETEPVGARIFERGKYQGKTPLEIRLGEGLHVLVFVRENYEAEAVPVVIMKGVNTPISVKFIPK